MPSRKPSLTVRRIAAEVGERLAAGACDVYGLAEDLGVSKPTVARAIRHLRACGFTICSESRDICGGHSRWMFTGLYSMPELSAKRWRSMKAQPVGSFGILAIAGALEGGDEP